MADRQWTQEQRVDDAEDHGVRGDAECDQQSSYQREAGAPAVEPRGIAEIAQSLAHFIAPSVSAGTVLPAASVPALTLGAMPSHTYRAVKNRRMPKSYTAAP